MRNLNKKDDFDSNNVDTKLVVKIIIAIALFVFGFYFHNFHHSLSGENGDWGTFGDYVGGILNPIIAGFAFYLIAKSYELQKTELEATRILLEISTDAQKKQIELAALTAIINSNLNKINEFKSRVDSIDIGVENINKSNITPSEGFMDNRKKEKDNINEEIKNLEEENNSFEQEIKNLLKSLRQNK